MTIDQNSITNDIRPLNFARTVVEEPRLQTTAGFAQIRGGDVGSPVYYPVTVLASGGNPTTAWCPYQQIPNSGGMVDTTVSRNVNDQANEEVVDDSSVKKVKLLCSFGGKILPRPNDGLLRYVGGQTRIISVNSDISYEGLQHKMIDTYGQPVVIKYQLPNEDLDALVSVSCAEDVENMMDEYGKFVGDGSGKLRVFLFSAAELDASGLVQFGEVLDSGQRYIDAINGVGGITRKESVASATSTQNSVGVVSWSEAVESSAAPSQGDGCGIPSPSMMSPRVAVVTDAPTNMVYVTPSPVLYAEPPAMPIGHPITSAPQALSSLRPEPRVETLMPGIVPQQQASGYSLQQPAGVDFQSPAGYIQAFVDPRQQISSEIGYTNNPQLLGVAAGSIYRHADSQQQLHPNVVSIPSQQFVPAVHMTMAPPAFHAGMNTNGFQQFVQTSQSRIDPYPGENSFGARAVQFPFERGYTAAYQSQATAPLQATGYSWNQIPPPPPQHVVVSDGWTTHQPGILPEKHVKLEDCHMCQKALPHSHSDTLAQDHGNNTKSNFPDTNPIFHGTPVEIELGIRPPNKGVVSEAFGERMTERQETIAQQRAGMVHDVAATQFRVPGCKEPILQKTDNPEHPRILFSQGMMGKPGDAKAPSGVLGGNIPLPYQEDALQQPPVPIPYPVKQEALANQPPGTNILPTSFIPLPSAEAIVQDPTTEYLGKLPFDGRVKIRGSPSDVSGSTEQCNSPINKHREEEMPIGRTQITGQHQDLFPATDFTRTGIFSDGNHIKMFDMLPSSSPEMAHVHNLQLVESSQGTYVEMRGTSGPYPHLNKGVHHMPSDQMWDDKPAFSNVESAHGIDGTRQIGDWKDEASWFQSRTAPNDIAADPLSGMPLSSSDGVIQDNWNAAPSNSLFSNQDPWTLRHDARVPFPKASQVPSSNEGLNMKEQGVLQNPERRSDKEEHIKQELQAVAEGVAALVLQSSIPADFSLHGINDPTAGVSQTRSHNNSNEAKTTTKVEDARTRLTDKANRVLPISEGIGRLQIIKNSDLEVLRELGSGTFGTVYHGKWRGSDVAIKRINDRCFAGKPSEEDRMREDFWNEAIKLADLHHPNVVAFYGVVLDGPGGSVATVTEFMVNGSLRQALQRNDRTLDKRKRLLIAMDVAFGMEYLHGKNIVHFDLKSDNLLVNLRDPHRPICKVGDLGLSKVKCQTLISGGVRGTLTWMAPELLNGSSSLVSEKVDVFSFGIVMWELLTGEEPYADLHYGAIIGGIVSNTLRPPVPESCDPDWRSLMERCWSAEPSERPSFTEIVKWLRSVASSLPSKGQAQQQQQAGANLN